MREPFLLLISLYSDILINTLIATPTNTIYQSVVETPSHFFKTDSHGTPCMSIRLRDIPTKLNKTNSGEYYLNLKVHDQLRLMFNKACDKEIRCVIYKNDRPSNTLTTDSSDTDTIVELNHNYIRCSRNLTDFFRFHLFVRNNNRKFFTGETVIYQNNTGTFLKCLGGYYTTNVKLLGNQKLLQTSYDPMRGFYIDNRHNQKNKFYQCQHGDELFSFWPQNLNNDSHKDEFKMLMHSYVYTSEILCVLENNNLANKNATVFLACPSESECPKLTRRATEPSRIVFVASIPKTTKVDFHSYFCVLTDNEEIKSIALLRVTEFSIIPYMMFACGVGVIIVFLGFLTKAFKDRSYEKIKPIDIHEFREAELTDKTEVGMGNSSTIYTAEFKKTKKVVIVKDSRRTTQCIKELSFLKTLKHPNIITPYGKTVLPVRKLCFEVRTQHLVLPYYMEGSLESYLQKFYPVKRVDNVFYSNENAFPEKTVTLFDMIGMGWQIARALEYLRRMQITHGDVALRNILITDEKICKLTDFELAKNGETRKVTFSKKLSQFFKIHKPKEVPIIYPDECSGGAYYYSTEVYCFGNLLLEMFQFVKKWDSPREYPPSQPFHCPDLIYDLIVNCMNNNRKRRPTIEKCVDTLCMKLKDLNYDKFLSLEKLLIFEGSRDVLKELLRPVYSPAEILFPFENSQYND